MDKRLRSVIDRAWDERDSLGPDTRGEVRQAVDAALAALDSAIIDAQSHLLEAAADGCASLYPVRFLHRLPWYPAPQQP